jgi:hypothetical protein
VERAVTAAAQNDEVLFAVRPQLASPNHVVDLELIAPAALLTLPAIPLQEFICRTASFDCKPIIFLIAPIRNMDFSRAQITMHSGGKTVEVQYAGLTSRKQTPVACGPKTFLLGLLGGLRR